jgi:hypothetical protein
MTQDPKEPNQSSTANSGSSHWPWAMALMVTACCGLIGFAVHECAHVPAAIADGLKNFAPSTTTNTVINTYLGDLHPQKKLVVLQTSINVESHTVRRTDFPLGIYGGRTIVSLRANGNQIQYYVPLEDMTGDDFKVDLARHVIRVTIPRPRLDEDFVDVQTNPAKLDIKTDLGWSSLDRYEGAELREESLKELRLAVIQDGKTSVNLLGYAADHALTVFRDQIAARFASALGGDWVAEVNFRSHLPTTMPSS